MSSVLVDFYNLHLSELSSENERILGNLVSLKFTTNKLRRIWCLLQDHATPWNIRKITKKEKEKAREFLEGVSIDLSNMGENVETKELPLVRKDEGTYEYAAINSIVNHNYSDFGELHHHIETLIDEFLDGYIAVDSLEWLERHKKDYSGRVIVKKDYSELYTIESLLKGDKSRISRDDYTIAWLPRPIISPINIDEMKLALSNLFHSIYDEAILVLKGDLQIQTCQRDGCNNIYLKSGKGSGNRKYCSECSNKGTYRENQNEVHQNLCYLIDKWLGRQDSRNVTASELKKLLNAERGGITDTPFLSGATAKNLGQYLKHIKKMLEDEYGIKYEKEREGSQYTYHFIRIQS